MAHTIKRLIAFLSVFHASLPAFLTLRFSDLELEEKFKQYYKSSSVNSVRLLCYIGIVFMIAFVWQDRMISPKNGQWATCVRLYIGLPACLITILATYQQSVQTYIYCIQFITVFIISLCTVAIFSAYQGTPYGLTTSTGMGNMLILLFAIFGISIFMFREMLMIVIIIIIIYSIPAWILWDRDWGEFLLGDFFTVVTFGVMGACISFAHEKRQREAFATSLKLTEEQERNSQLLFEILPAAIARRVRNGETPIAESLSEVTILFADLVGFTEITQRLAPRYVIRLLDELFGEYDEVARRLGVQKIKTIGDGYMAACGSLTDEDARAVAVAQLAREMIDITNRISDNHNMKIMIRIGMHTGSVVAGVIGKSQLTYDLWGETVNLASRLESNGLPGKIQISHATDLRLSRHFECEERGEIELKGVGRIKTYFLGAPRLA